MLARGEIITHKEFMRQMEEQERRLLNRAMELAGNKKMEAAQLLGMNYNSMTYRRDLLGIGEKKTPLKAVSK